MIDLPSETDFRPQQLESESRNHLQPALKTVRAARDPRLCPPPGYHPTSNQQRTRFLLNSAFLTPLKKQYATTRLSMIKPPVESSEVRIYYDQRAESTGG